VSWAAPAHVGRSVQAISRNFYRDLRDLCHTESDVLEGAETRYWHPLDDGRVQCDLCPRACKLREGQRGFCFVRARRNDEIVLTTHGRSSGLAVDPIEKKPLSHFLPGSAVLSFGTAGCNLSCRFCQNWSISKARRDETAGQSASPEEIAAAAERLECASVAFTYNEPVVFLEYALDTAEACHARGIRTVAVTNGYILPEPRAELCARLDAANVDLKSFNDGFYRCFCGGRLAPVLETLEYVACETEVWLEVTNLLIPGLNDSEAETAELSRWIYEHLGPDVPLHLSAFHPAFRLLDRPPTPAATLARARAIALETGLRFVYTGNVRDFEGESTFCPPCGALLIERRGYRIGAYKLTGEGACRFCGERIPGVFPD
jgi:pyruvate formate lyase activating enzyme